MTAQKAVNQAKETLKNKQGNLEEPTKPNQLLKYVKDPGEVTVTVEDDEVTIALQSHADNFVMTHGPIDSDKLTADDIITFIENNLEF